MSLPGEGVGESHGKGARVGRVVCQRNREKVFGESSLFKALDESEKKINKYGGGFQVSNFFLFFSGELSLSPISDIR